eukprot:Clim_evm10s203 gene=Clim_evmTU10s203
MPQLIFTQISRGTIVLVEYSSLSNNLDAMVRQLLPKIGNENVRMSYLYQGYLIHYLKENGIVYLTCTPERDGRQFAFQFLTKLREESLNIMNEETLRNAPPYETNQKLLPMIQKLSQRAVENPGSLDVLTRAQNESQALQESLIQDIEKVIERGERVDILIDRTSDLNEEAGVFATRSRKVAQKMWWKNTKWGITIAVVVAVLVTVAVIMALRS